MDEAALIAKLAKIEALFAGATTEGERAAAASARDRIVARLREVEKADPPIEFKFTPTDAWSHRLLLALLRRYGIKPYRFKGQRRTTVMARVAKSFVDDTLWPEFQQLSATLQTYLDEVTTRVVAQVVHGDTSDASEVAEPKQLEPPPSAQPPAQTTPHPPPARAESRSTAVSAAGKVGRNDPCPCGSGRKYKKCCAA